MRIRSTKPEFWRSQDISGIRDWGVRLLFIGLWSYVDDNGVGLDRVSLITADLFADDLERDPSETFAKVSRGLQQLVEADLIVRYTFGDKQFLFVKGWGKHQRIDHPNEPRYPLPDGAIAHPTRVNSKTSRAPKKTSRKSRENLAPGTGEQGNRGTGEQGKEDDAALPPEPPFDPGAEPRDVVVDDAPASVGTAAARPPRRYPSSAALTVVRQVLGSAGYPKPTIERLAIQVEKLAHDGHPDALIRQALVEWDRRPNCDRPEFLPTVLGDLVKLTRAQPEVSSHDEKVNGYLAFAGVGPSHPEIER